MIVGHCPECGQVIQGFANGNVQACHHTPPVLLILAGLFGETFDQTKPLPPSAVAHGKSE